MRIPILDISKFLDTKEMREAAQKKLNDDEEVVHTIIGVSDINIEVRAYLDAELQIKWEVYREYSLIKSNIEVENLYLETIYVVGQDE